MDSVFPPAHLAWPPRLYRPQAPLSRLQPRIHLLFERQDRLGPPFWRTMAPAFRRTITVGNARAFFVENLLRTLGARYRANTVLMADPISSPLRVALIGMSGTGKTFWS